MPPRGRQVYTTWTRPVTGPALVKWCFFFYAHSNKTHIAGENQGKTHE